MNFKRLKMECCGQGREREKVLTYTNDVCRGGGGGVEPAIFVLEEAFNSGPVCACGSRAEEGRSE